MGPDRTKGKVASMVFESMRPSFAASMRMGSEKNLNNAMKAESEEHEAKEYAQNGALALRALFSALQSGDFEAAYRAYYNVHIICDANIDEDEGEG
jgi:hypothetical protein